MTDFLIIDKLLDKLSVSDTCFHMYADDTQLYVSFPASSSISTLSSLSDILNEVHSWFTANILTVDPSKTEFMLVGTRQQRAKLVSPTLSFQDHTLAPSNTFCNLGVIFDSDLDLKYHIAKVCQSWVLLCAST